MKMMVLSNPRVAAVITMIALFAIGTVISYLLMRLHERRRLKKHIDSITDAALSARDETILMLQHDIFEKDERINHLETRIARVAVFLGKAIEESGGK